MAKKTRRVPRFDSPITVGGGGGGKRKGRRVPFYIEVNFDHADYITDPEDPSSFVNPTVTLDRVLINNNPPVTLANVPITVTPTSDIVVIYKKGLHNKQRITINGGPFGITFKSAHIPFDFQSDQHEASGLRLLRVLIDGIEAKLLPNAYNKIEVRPA